MCKAHKRRYNWMKNMKWRWKKGYKSEKGERWADRESLQKSSVNIIEENPILQDLLKSPLNQWDYYLLSSRNLFSFRISLLTMRKFSLMPWKKHQSKKEHVWSKKEMLEICYTLWSQGSTIVLKKLMELQLSWRLIIVEIFLESWPYSIMPQEQLPLNADKLENSSLWIEELSIWSWLELPTKKGSILLKP